MLSLSTRDARLGQKFSGKPLKAAELESPRLLTFELEDIELDAQELNVLLQEPHAHASLYNHTRDGIRPFLKCFKALELDGAIEGAFVSLSWISSTVDFKFASAKLTAVKLTLGADEGKTLMRCKVTVEPTLDESLAELVAQMGKAVAIELRGEPPGAQQDLALNTHGEGEQPETRRRGRNGKQPRAH